MTIVVIVTVLLVDETGETTDKFYSIRLYQIHLVIGDRR